MTTFTMRRVGGDFVVTGPDIEPKKFKTRREARDWCTVHYPGSPIREIVPLRKHRPAKERQAGAGEQGPPRRPSPGNDGGPPCSKT